MNIVQLVLAAIGAVVVFGFLCLAVGALWLAWQIHKCERNEARAWQQERTLQARQDWFDKPDEENFEYKRSKFEAQREDAEEARQERLREKKDEDTKPYSGERP